MSNKKSKLKREIEGNQKEFNRRVAQLSKCAEQKDADKDCEFRDLLDLKISTLSENELKNDYASLQREYKSLFSLYEETLISYKRVNDRCEYLTVYIDALKDKFLPKEVDRSKLSAAVYLIFSVLSFIALIYLICLLTP